MSRTTLTAPLLLLVVSALGVSLLEGAPDRLPAVALDSTVLLYVERAGAMFAIVVAVAVVLREAWRGRLPTQVTTTGLAYEGDAAADAKEAVEALQEQVDDLRTQIAALADATLGGEGPRG